MNDIFDGELIFALACAREYQAGVSSSSDGFKPQMKDAQIDPVKIIRAIKELEASIKGLREEAKYWAEKAKNAEMDAESLRLYLLKTQPPGKVDVYSLVHGEAESVVVNDLDSLCPAYIRIKKEADKKLLKEDLSNGEVVPGAHLEKTEFLVIR